MSEILRISQEQYVYKVKLNTFEFRLLIRMEKKNIVWMKGIVQTFKKPGNTVADAVTGTYSIFKACLLPPKNRKYLGCKEDPRFLTEKIRQLILICAQNLLSKGSEIDGDGQIHTTAMVCVK